MERIIFSSGITGYRITRLTFELFLVMRMQELGFEIKQAGILFLIYSAAAVVCGLFFLIYPTICFGSGTRGLLYVVLSTTSMVVGLIGTFQAKQFEYMAYFAALGGFGTTFWNINYQALTNLSFPKSHLGQVSLLRQLFECVGLLLPSISLAFVSNIQTSGRSVVSVNATVLGLVTLLFCFVAASQMVPFAARVPTQNQSRENIFHALRHFFLSSLIKSFLVNALVLSISSIMMGTMFTITKGYFGLDPKLLWVGALCFPIGGIIAMVFKTMSRRALLDCKTRLLIGSSQIAIALIMCIGFTPLMPPEFTDALVCFSFFALVFGCLYSNTFAASLELWLINLKDESVNFVLRASIINNFATQAVIATVFQVQTLLIDTAQDAKQPSSFELDWPQVCVYFLPVIFLCVMVGVLMHFIPYPRDERFKNWPAPFQFREKLLILFINDTLRLHSTAKTLTFGIFQLRRMTFLMKRMVIHNTSVNGGPSVSRGPLKPESFQAHLKRFDSLNTRDRWWRSSDAKLCKILLDNASALDDRLELIYRAKSSVLILTWTFEQSAASIRIVDALIKKAGEGLDVRVLVDNVTLYYLCEKKKLIGGSEIEIYGRMIEGGVSVRTLETWHLEDEPTYVIGTHRKLILVDSQYLLTGGRNISDKYFTSGEAHHYLDADFLLQGNFGSSTQSMYDSFWERSKEFPLLSEPEYAKNDVCDKDVIESSSGESLEQFFSDGKEVALFQIDHEAGSDLGYDMILSALMFLVENAKDSVVLAFGYFQLFNCLDSAVGRAVERGVKIRVIANSTKTNSDLVGFNPLFKRTCKRLLDMGVEVFVPSSQKQLQHGCAKYSLHYKAAVIDSRVAMVGSWNCMGTSVFYDAELSAVLFDQSDSGDAFAPIEDMFTDSVKSGELVPIQMTEENFRVPLVYLLAAGKWGRKQFERGY